MKFNMAVTVEGSSHRTSPFSPLGEKGLFLWEFGERSRRIPIENPVAAGKGGINKKAGSKTPRVIML